MDANLRLPAVRVGCLGVAAVLCTWACSQAPQPGPLGEGPIAEGGSGQQDVGRPDALAPDASRPEVGGPDALATDASTAVGDAPADRGPPPAPVCNPSKTWGNGVAVPVTAGTVTRFAAITPDELTIAWLSAAPDAGADAGAALAVSYADRTSTTASFGAPNTLSTLEASGFEGAALQADGLGLTLSRSDGFGFVQLTRASRSVPFDPVLYDNVFNVINLYFKDNIPPDTYMGDPTLSADGLMLAFSLFGGGRTDTIVESRRLASDPIWGGANVFANTELAASGTARRRPSGLSADRLTLFFWDEVGQTERVAWRTWPDDLSFSMFADLGQRAYAQPNAACNRLYYSAPGASSVDLFYADAK
jgi:hypothetical protein